MNKKYFQIRDKKLRSLLDRCAKQPRVLNTSRSRKIIIKEMKRNKFFQNPNESTDPYSFLGAPHYNKNNKNKILENSLK